MSNDDLHGGGGRMPASGGQTMSEPRPAPPALGSDLVVAVVALVQPIRRFACAIPR